MTKKLLILLILISMIGITSCKTVETPRPIQVPTLTMERPSKPTIKIIEQDTAVKDLVLALTQVMGYSDRQDAFIDYYESYLADIIEILQR